MTDTTDAPDEVVADEARDALLAAVTAELGDALLEHHLIPGRDLWIRVAPEAFGDVAEYLRERQRFRFFDYLSAIDWLPSPYGRSLDAAVDVALGTDEDSTDEGGGEMVRGYAGGETRFQILARVYSLATGLGLHVKADVPESLSMPTWTDVYPGAEWHEREVWEMFGISFTGHPGLRHLYLPGGFEGYPMRKDYPLLARLVKPWPGIVDVEPMPEAPSTDNPEGAES